MMKQDKNIRRAVAFLGVSAIALLAVLSTAAAGPGKKNKGAKGLLHTHMKLAEFYMLDGQHSKAQKHFQAIIDTDLPASADNDPGAEVFGEAKGNKKGRKGGKKLVRARFRAYIGAAAAAHLQGNDDQAEAFAEAGIEWAQKKGAKKGVKILERFLDDPDEVVERIAPSVKDLELRLLTIKKAMDK
jgi:hypothetical protein